MESDDRKHISPTLAKFLQVSYSTKLSENEIIHHCWSYITKNKLFIDSRNLMLTSELRDVVYPKSINEAIDKTGVHIANIAKLHLDSDFIEADRLYHLESIKKRLLARKYFDRWRRRVRRV